MCVKRDSFRRKGISVPLGSLLGFAVIIVPSMKKEGKRLWFDCRKMWTLIKLPYANTGVRGSFPAHSKRMPGEGVGGKGCVWDFGVRLVFFFPLPSGKYLESSAFLWKSVHGSQSPLKPLGSSLHCLDIGIFTTLNLPSLFPPSFSPPSLLPPLPPYRCVHPKRAPGSGRCQRQGASRVLESLREPGESRVILASFLQRSGALLLLANHEGALK